MKVYYGRRTLLSGRLLQSELRGIKGRSINFGYPFRGEINSPRAINRASNKRRALAIMQESGVPVPPLYDGEFEFPCVGRPDRHRRGHKFFLCQNDDDVAKAQARGASHFMRYIEDGREFRVHIAFGQSIKIAEKVGGHPVVKNFEHGSSFVYPYDFYHKASLRHWAKLAVKVLGLDFGAVDIIYKDGKCYILEVNTAPSLTSQSDVLSRYVSAFMLNAESESDE